MLVSHASHAIVLLADGRFTHRASADAYECVLREETFFPPAPFAAFEVADQQSSMAISPDGRSLSGSARGSGGARSGPCGACCDFGAADSQFSIAFRIEGEGGISLDGTLSGGLNPLGVARVTLLHGSDVLYEATSFFDAFLQMGVDVPVSFEAALVSGVYTLRASAGGGNPSFNSFDFSFEVLDSIPEPATAFAVGGGLSVFGAVRRRSRKCRSPSLGSPASSPRSVGTTWASGAGGIDSASGS